jgi:hypothetical protein
VIFQVGNASGIVGLGIISKNILAKVFFTFVDFFLIWGFVSKKLKNGPSRR